MNWLGHLDLRILTDRGVNSGGKRCIFCNFLSFFCKKRGVFVIPCHLFVNLVHFFDNFGKNSQKRGWGSGLRAQRLRWVIWT